MKKMIKKPILFLVIVLTAFFTVSSVLLAANVDDLKDKKNNIDKQIQDKQSELKDNKAQQDNAQEQLDTINANLDAVQAEIDKIYNDLAVAEENLANQQVEYDNSNLSGKFRPDYKRTYRYIEKWCRNF